MDTDKAAEALERAFRRDIEDGTLEVRREGSAVIVDGGKWRLSANANGVVGLDLPMNDPNYYDEDTDQFIENVLALRLRSHWPSRTACGASGSILGIE